MAKGDAHKAFIQTHGRLPKRGELLKAEQKLRAKTGSSKGLVKQIKAGKVGGRKVGGKKTPKFGSVRGDKTSARASTIGKSGKAYGAGGSAG